MKKNEVKVGGVYTATVSNRVVQVRIDSTHSKQGWNATNIATGKRIHIKSAQRLRSAVKPKGAAPAKTDKKKLAATAKADQENARLRDERKRSPDGMTASERAMAKSAKPKKPTKPKRVSAIDAAATVLKKAGKPMNCKALIDAMAKQGLWQSPGGKTPHATLYSAILRDIQKQGAKSRFKKVERGQFAYAG